MNAIEAARDAIAVAVRAKQPVAPWRVHEHEPVKPVTPCIYVGVPTLNVETVGSPGARFTVADFPVFIAVDGAQRAQREALDVQLAAVWDAAVTVGDPTEARPATINVAGVPLDGIVVQVEIPLRALTLCPPNLEAV